MKLKEAAKILLRKPSIKLTDDQELVDACRELHQKGWADYRPAETKPIVFPARFLANEHTQLALKGGQANESTKNIVARFKEWKGFLSEDDQFDEIHNFVNRMERGEMLEMMNLIEEEFGDG